MTQPTPAMAPFFEVLQELIRNGEPPRKSACRWCDEAGGDNCSHCEPQDMPDEEDL